MRKRANPETEIQVAVLAHINQRGVPGLVAWHTPNGGFRTPIEAKIFKTMGVKSGIPDVFLLHGGRLYALELKAPGGKPTETQLCTLAELHTAGAIIEIAVGLDEAIETLENWGLLRGRV